MSQPFPEIPDPWAPRPTRRRFQPGVVQEALQQALRAALHGSREALRVAQRASREALLAGKRHADNLWLRGKRNPRTFGVIGAAVALTLVGAYAVNASGVGDSLCPPAGRADRKSAPFLLLMDRVPHPAAGSEVEIHYDVCGLASGTPYRGRVRLTSQRAAGKTGKKKKSAQPKPLVVTFKDEVDGLATRRRQQLELGSTKPGAYTLELSVVDNQGRERKRLQKVLVKAQ